MPKQTSYDYFMSPEDNLKAQESSEKKEYLENMLQDLTLEEKVEFLITHYIKSHI